MIWSQLFVIGRARRRLRASRSSYDLPPRVGALGAALRPPAPLIAGLVGQGDEAVTPAARRLRGLPGALGRSRCARWPHPGSSRQKPSESALPSRRLIASEAARTISTFSCDIAHAVSRYSRSPALAPQLGRRPSWECGVPERPNAVTQIGDLRQIPLNKAAVCGNVTMEWRCSSFPHLA